MISCQSDSGAGKSQLILDTVTYLRAVIYEATGEANAPIEVQNEILKFILTRRIFANTCMNGG